MKNRRLNQRRLGDHQTPRVTTWSAYIYGRVAPLLRALGLSSPHNHGPGRNGLLQPTRLVLEDVKFEYTMIWTELDLAPAQA